MNRPGSRRGPNPPLRPNRSSPGAKCKRALRRMWADPAGRFLLRYPIFTALVFVLPGLWPSGVSWLVHATVQSLALARIVVPTMVQATNVGFAIGRTSIAIVPDCTPLSPTLLLVGGILAFPAHWKSKALGIAVGAIVVWAYNMVRIYLLMAVLRYAPAEFDLVHVYLWQTATLLLVVGCFLLWIRLTWRVELAT